MSTYTLPSVTLSELDLRLAEAVAAQRTIEVEWAERARTYGQPGEYGHDDEGGALAEMAFLIFYREKWGIELEWDVKINASRARLKGPDMLDPVTGSEWHVRGVTRENSTKLLIRPDDHGWFALVLAQQSPLCWLPGYVNADEVKRPEWGFDGNGRPPCWLVPQGELTRWT